MEDERERMSSGKANPWVQTAIAVLGGFAIFGVSAFPDTLGRWGVLAGLASQPCWIYSAWKARQWGILALSLWYTFAWACGVYTYWLK